VQERESISINRMDTSLSRSTQLEAAIPPSKIAALSSGEFVGTVADDPENRIDLKVFHSEILNDHNAIRKEEAAYNEIPVVRTISQSEIQKNYFRIKEEISHIANTILNP
jgi:hypothetical protein